MWLIFHRLFIQLFLHLLNRWWAPSKFDPMKSPMLFFEKSQPVIPPVPPDVGLDKVLKHMVHSSCDFRNISSLHCHENSIWRTWWCHCYFVDNYVNMIKRSSSLEFRLAIHAYSSQFSKFEYTVIMWVLIPQRTPKSLIGFKNFVHVSRMMYLVAILVVNMTFCRHMTHGPASQP